MNQGPIEPTYPCGRIPFVAALGVVRSRARELVWDVFLEGGKEGGREGAHRLFGSTAAAGHLFRPDFSGYSQCGCSSLLQPIVGTGAIHPLTGCSRGAGSKCNCKIDKKLLMSVFGYQLFLLCVRLHI